MQEKYIYKKKSRNERDKVLAVYPCIRPYKTIRRELCKGCATASYV